jgi:hypothetical protein
MKLILTLAVAGLVSSLPVTVPAHAQTSEELVCRQECIKAAKANPATRGGAMGACHRTCATRYGSSSRKK